MRAQTLLALVAATALASSGCRPAARGRCHSSAECRDGAVCSVDGICLSSSGQCTPACDPSTAVCSGHACQPLKPALSIEPIAGGLVSPSRNALTVDVTADPAVPLGALHVEVSDGATLASADLPAAQPGKNAVVLSHFVPGVEGQVTMSATLGYTRTDGTTDQASSVSLPAAYDDAPPVVASIFFPAGQGQAGEWFGPDGADIEIRAEVADGAQGSGPAAARLSFDPPCPVHVQCGGYAGTLVSSGGERATFSFKVPRAAQAPGSDAPLGFHVDATDRAGNSAPAAAGTLRIDARPPQLGAVALLSAGTTGEDGHTWFAGGQGAPPIDLSVALGDSGAGVDPASVSLSLVAADVDLDPGPISATFPTPADGTAHFRVPAGAVTTREGRVRFGVTARDRLGQAASLSPAGALYIDAVPPQISLARAEYGSAQPPWAQVCAADLAVVCGRGPSAAPVRALRDDQLTLTFDVLDCGAGLAGAGQPVPAGWSITSGGQQASGVASLRSTSPGGCSNGSTNQLHSYSFALRLAADLPVLDAPDASGAVHLAVDAGAHDLLGQANEAIPDQAATGDGFVDISLVRWKRQLGGLATGAPLLTSARSVVVGTAASANNVVAVAPDGSVAWQTTLSPPPAGELALGASTIYAATNSQRVYLLTPNPPGANEEHFDISGAVFGAPLAIFPPAGSDAEAGIAVPTMRSTGSANLYAFSHGKQSSATVVTSASAGALFSGVTQAGGQVFVAHDAGFSSTALSGGAFTLSATNYTNKQQGLAPPALRGDKQLAGQQPVFPAADGNVRRTAYRSSCAGSLGSACWIDGWTSAAGQVRVTPVFDDRQVVATSAAGTVTAWRTDSGAQLWQTASPNGPTQRLASGPVLLKPPDGGSPGAVLVVSNDGRVRRLTPPSSPGAPAETVLLVAGAFESSATPPFPAVDARGAGGLAYLTDGAGWLFALQLDDAPAAAGTTVWPRPSRDSCNSRSADSPCR